MDHQDVIEVHTGMRYAIDCTLDFVIDEAFRNY